jgi:hypothetical protein
MVASRKRQPKKVRPSRRGVVKNKIVKTSRSNASTVLAQGVGALPSRPFGSIRARPSLACWDAKLPQHLSLPRAVGPYTTVRTTKRIRTDSACMIFGTFKRPESTSLNTAEWSNVCAVGSVDASLAVNASPANARMWTSPLSFFSAGTSGATCVPSAMTVQVLNPEPLQITTGIIYAGVMSTQAAIGGRTASWTSWFDSFVNFMSPRLLSAAKLSLRGVQVSTYPLNMTPISEFTELFQRADGDVTYTEAVEEPTGWAPILVSNPGQVALEYLVTTEWRVRFDLINPASAGHSHHPIHHDGDWDRLMKQATSFGHGVHDIVETVANVGQAAETAMRVASFFK